MAATPDPWLITAGREERLVAFVGDTIADWEITF